MFQITEFNKQNLDNSSNTIIDKYDSRCEDFYYFKDNMSVDYDYTDIYEYIRELNERVQNDTNKLTNWMSTIGVDSSTVNEIRETINDIIDYVETNVESAEITSDIIDNINDPEVVKEPPFNSIVTSIANTAKETIETAIKEDPGTAKVMTEIVNTVKGEVNNEASKVITTTTTTDSKITLSDLAKAAEDSKKATGDMIKDAFTPDAFKSGGAAAAILNANKEDFVSSLTGGSGKANVVKDLVTDIISGNIKEFADIGVHLKDLAKSAGPQVIAQYLYGVAKDIGIDYLNNQDKQAFANALNDLVTNIDSKVEDYLKDHPNATRTEVQNAIIDGFRDTIYEATKSGGSLVTDWQREQTKADEIDKSIAVALGLEYNGYNIPVVGNYGSSPNIGLNGLTEESATKLNELYEAIANATSQAYDANHSSCSDTGCGCNDSCDTCPDSSCDSCGCDDSCDSCSSDCDYCSSDTLPCGNDSCDVCNSDYVCNDCGCDDSCDSCSDTCDTCSDSCDCSTDTGCGCDDCGCDDTNVCGCDD